MIEQPGRLVLLGYSIGYSRSPRFQNAALEAAGIPLTYELCDVIVLRNTTRTGAAVATVPATTPRC